VTVAVAVADASRRHAVTSRLHVDTSRHRAFASRAASLSLLEPCRVVSRDGGVARVTSGVGDFVLDVRRWGSILGQNEKGETSIGSKSIPGQAEPNGSYRCVPKLKTAHLNPLDWALFRANPMEPNEALESGRFSPTAFLRFTAVSVQVRTPFLPQETIYPLSSFFSSCISCDVIIFAYVEPHLLEIETIINILLDLSNRDPHIYDKNLRKLNIVYSSRRTNGIPVQSDPGAREELSFRLRYGWD
jgi:hypothetical protein